MASLAIQVVNVRYGAADEKHSLNVLQRGGSWQCTGLGSCGPFATFQVTTDAATSTLTLETPLGALALSGDALCATPGAAPAAFTQHPCPAAPGHCLLSCAGGYLALGPAPKLAVGLCALPQDATPLRLAPARLAWGAALAAVAARRAEAPLPPQAVLALPPPPPFALSPEDLAHFAEQGFVVVRESAARASVECALRAINAELGQGNLFAAAPAGAPPAPLAGGNHSSHPALLALLASSRAGAAVAQLLGPARAPAAPPRQCQVAPRFPQPLPPRAALAALAAPPGAGLAGALPEEDRAEARRGAKAGGQQARWHIDGTGKGAAYPFSLLVGAFLSDTQGEGEGQLTVFPGSHLHLATRLAAPGGEAALYGEEAKGGGGAARCSLPEACRPLQLRVRAGDAVIAHPLLAHRVGVNYGPHVRHAVFFRVKARGGREGSARAALVAGALFGELEGLPQQPSAAAAAAAQ